MLTLLTLRASVHEMDAETDYLREYRQNVLEMIGRPLLCSLSDNTAPGLPTDMLQIWYEHGFRIMASGYTLRITRLGFYARAMGATESTSSCRTSSPAISQTTMPLPRLQPQFNSAVHRFRFASFHSNREKWKLSAHTSFATLVSLLLVGAQPGEHRK
jgi:hypothetical protein